jgi:hypothetical protein
VRGEDRTDERAPPMTERLGVDPDLALGLQSISGVLN